MKEKHFRKNKGITLIALIVTIIVLLILAGISIIMLTGQNGILNRAGEAKEKTGIAQIDESVKLAVADALTKGTGSITKTNLEEALNKYVGEGNYGLSDVTDGWKISAGGKRYNVTSQGGISEEDDSKTPSIGDIYSEPGITEDDIAPADIFSYKILDEEAKTAAITKINVECSVLERVDQRYTYYGFNRDDVTDTLVVPYEYTSDEGKKYTIVEASINGIYTEDWMTFCFIPNNIKTIIFPNTIIELKKTEECSAYYADYAPNKSLTKVVLPNKLQKVGGFMGCQVLSLVDLPETVSEIGKEGFRGCENLPVSELLDGIKIIGDGAFEENSGTEQIIIPNSVKNIGALAFADFNGLKEVIIQYGVESIGGKAFSYNAFGSLAYGCWADDEIKITIPSSVVTMESYVFCNWPSTSTINVQFKKSEIPSGWNNEWNQQGGTIKYLDE